MSATLMEMQTEIETCNDLQVTVLANTQEEPQIEEKSEFLEEDNPDEIEIVPNLSRESMKLSKNHKN
ncbi:hypothetical protein HAX54_026436 [Datura stramonium]|uniref:Uncharacterized protein n=1 Tax=Datura stramonium TaxID=4076 RepID=A0ABS8V169_DATST|nr:hypothetical protein [Datura stramonium]